MTKDEHKPAAPAEGMQETPETAAALAEVERLEAETGLNRADLTPEDMEAEGGRGDLARAVAAYGATFRPAAELEPKKEPERPDPSAVKHAKAKRKATEAAKQTDAANAGATDPAKVAAEQAPALPADLRERMAADVARLDVLEQAAAKAPPVDTSVADAARARRNAALRAEDERTGRAAVRSAQIYGGLEGGEYALNPADPTNRARVLVDNVPAPADTGAANGTAGTATGGGAPVPTQGQMRPLPEHLPGMVAGPVAPASAPAVPGPSGAPAPTKLPDAAKGS